jgi:hypothetical protein
MLSNRMSGTPSQLNSSPIRQAMISGLVRIFLVTAEVHVQQRHHNRQCQRCQRDPVIAVERADNRDGNESVKARCTLEYATETGAALRKPLAKQRMRADQECRHPQDRDDQHRDEVDHRHAQQVGAT